MTLVVSSPWGGATKGGRSSCLGQLLITEEVHLSGSDWLVSRAMSGHILSSSSPLGGRPCVVIVCFALLTLSTMCALVSHTAWNPAACNRLTKLSKLPKC